MGLHSIKYTLMTTGQYYVKCTVHKTCSSHHMVARLESVFLSSKISNKIELHGGQNPLICLQLMFLYYSCLYGCLKVSQIHLIVVKEKLLLPSSASTSTTIQLKAEISITLIFQHTLAYDSHRQLSTAHDSSRQFSTAIDSTRQPSTAFNSP